MLSPTMISRSMSRLLALAHTSPSRRYTSSPSLSPEGGEGLRSVQYFAVYDVFAIGLAVEDAQNVLHRGYTHAVDCLARDAGDMRCGNEVRQGQERIVLGRRLFNKHVKRGAGDTVRLKDVIKRPLIDNAAAGGIDDDKLFASSGRAGRRQTDRPFPASLGNGS